MTIDVKEQKKDDWFCPECKEYTDTIEDEVTGDVICRECGLVIKERIIDIGKEWRSYTPEEVDKRARTGGSISLSVYDKNLNTIIMGFTDAYGNPLSGKKKSEISRLRRIDNRSKIHSTEARNLSQAMSHLNLITSRMELPRNVIDHAAFLYRKYLKQGVLRSKCIEGMMFAAIYSACRILRVPRTFADFVGSIGMTEKKLKAEYRRFVTITKIQVPSIKGEDHIAKMCSALMLSQYTQGKVSEMLEAVRSKGMLSGRSPLKVVPAIIYIVSILEGERRSQKEVADVANITEVTLRNRYKEIIKELKISWMRP
jgi:transcription initiation factor TFIIB